MCAGVRVWARVCVCRHIIYIYILWLKWPVCDIHAYIHIFGILNQIDSIQDLHNEIFGYPHHTSIFVCMYVYVYMHVHKWEF